MVTGFVFVLVPEYLPITETRKGIDHLAQFDLRVANLVVNKILPESVTDPFFKGRLEQQGEYRRQIDDLFPEQAKLELPLLGRDIDTLDSLRVLSERMEQAMASEHN